MTIFAWRQWRIDEAYGCFLLAMTRDGPENVWFPGTNKATCNRPYRGLLRHWKEKTPVASCTCGFYALRSYHHAQMSWGFAVLGVVELWGKVIPATYGYRAQYARPVAIVSEPPYLIDYQVRLPLYLATSRVYHIPLLSSVDIANKEYMV